MKTATSDFFLLRYIPKREFLIICRHPGKNKWRQHFSNDLNVDIGSSTTFNRRFKNVMKVENHIVALHFINCKTLNIHKSQGHIPHPHSDIH